MNTKKCITCNLVKSYADFCRDWRRRDGRHPECKACVKIRKRDYYRRNRPRILDETTAYQRTHDRRRYKHAWYLWKKGVGKKPVAHKPKAKIPLALTKLRRLYHENYVRRKRKDPDAIRAYARAYYAKHRCKLRKSNRTSYMRLSEDSKRRRRKYARNYARSKRKSDVGFRIAHNVRNRINDAIRVFLRTGHVTKATSTENLLGYNFAEYMKYLSQKFKAGMSWSNYGFGKGKWNIDHIIPCTHFDLSKSEEQRACFHYLNTQPMWHLENVAKGKR